jgi:adenylate kinase family enzyme
MKKVTDEVIMEMLKEKIKEKEVDEKGYIIEGFPLTMAQANVKKNFLFKK